MVEVTKVVVFEAERWASAAAGSRSVAEAVGSRLQALVRCGGVWHPNASGAFFLLLFQARAIVWLLDTPTECPAQL
jgi:hypothetical protein